jgi:hypothetical protein
MKLKFKLVGIIAIAALLLGVQGFIPGLAKAESNMDYEAEYGPVEPADVAAPTGPEVGLTFDAVQPCRIVDTRIVGGFFFPNERREYYVYGPGPGPVGVAQQGGNPAGCPAPRQEPFGVVINVTAVPVGGQGNFRAYPADNLPPNASLLNYRTGVQNIANAASVQTFFSGGPRELEVQNRVGFSHLVIDVLGYYDR